MPALAGASQDKYKRYDPVAGPGFGCGGWRAQRGRPFRSRDLPEFF